MIETDKPDVTKLILMNFIEKDGPTTTLYIPLVDFQVYDSSGLSGLSGATFDYPADKIDFKRGSVLFGITDDPTMLHSQSWGNLGSSRLLFELVGACKVPDVKRLQFECAKIKRKQHMADREMTEDAYNHRFHF